MKKFKMVYEDSNLKAKESLKKQNLINQNNLNKTIKELKEKVSQYEIDKKKELEKIMKEYERIKKENDMLTNKNSQLQNELNQKQIQIQQLLSNNKNNIKKSALSNGSYSSNEIIGLINNNRQQNILAQNQQMIQNQQNQINMEQSIERPIKIEYPFDPYKEPTLIGLDNIGATCFMNSTLQCLSQTRDLTAYFLKKKSIDKILNNNIALKNRDADQLSPIYWKLILNLWNKNPTSRSFPPRDFMAIIEKLNPLFKQGEAGDSKDFIIFLLEQFHTELKKPVGQNKTPQQNLNQYDKNNAFDFFFNDFKQECSIISDIFFGITETTNICLNCKNNYNSKGLANPICYNYQIANCFIFPLEEVKNMKNNMMQNNGFQIYNNNIVSILECFYYFQKTDLFTGSNQNYCNICKQLSDSLYTSKIFISPNVLVLILNRGKDNVFNVKLNFTEEIDISEFVLQKEKPRIIYSLYGVITHIGQSGPSAHFVASCKSPINNKWYRYNDSIVNPIENIQRDIIDFGTPYILFYQKK